MKDGHSFFPTVIVVWVASAGFILFDAHARHADPVFGERLSRAIADNRDIWIRYQAHFAVFCVCSAVIVLKAAQAMVRALRT